MAKDPRSSLSGARILVVDDHRNIRVSLGHTLGGEGAIITEAESVASGLAKLGTMDGKTPPAFDVMLFDIRMPDGNGLDLLERVAFAGYASRVIMISGEGTMSEAFQATQNGAFDFIEKPFSSERVLVSIGRCLSFNNVQVQNEELTKSLLKGQELLGNHDSIMELRQAISRVAPTNGRVLILGESGTGKELVARAVHRESERKTKPLIKVNCAAIPHSLVESELFGHEKGSFTGATKMRRGLFEQADGGTLFLDEIGELSLDVQAKLLRVLQNGDLNRVGGEEAIKVDVRLLAATHRDLPEMVQNGEFREDLYYRLNVISLPVPPLRERGDDVCLLAQYFLDLASDEHSVGFRAFGPNALDEIRAYRWPGNIRELKNIVERCAILSETQTIDHIPDIVDGKSGIPGRGAGGRQELAATADPQVGAGDSHPRGSEGEGFAMTTSVIPWQEFHSAVGREYLKFVLAKSGGNVSEAARTLCLERAYLHRLMKKLGVQRDVVVSS